jgi:hypothetical protein
VTPLERNVWAAAFAAEFSLTRDFLHSNPGHSRTTDDISGFSCAEVADVALKKYREAVTGADREYLIPVQENDL